MLLILQKVQFLPMIFCTKYHNNPERKIDGAQSHPAFMPKAGLEFTVPCFLDQTGSPDWLSIIAINQLQLIRSLLWHIDKITMPSLNNSVNTTLRYPLTNFIDEFILLQSGLLITFYSISLYYWASFYKPPN